MALIWVSSPGEMGGPGLVAKLQSQQAEHVHGSVLVTVHPHARSRSWTASVGTDEDLMHTVGSAGLAVRALLGMLVAICIGHALPTCIVQLAGVKLINHHYPAPGCQLGYELLDRAPNAQKAPCILIAPVPKSHCGLMARLGCQTSADASQSALNHNVPPEPQHSEGLVHVPAQHPWQIAQNILDVR